MHNIYTALLLPLLLAAATPATAGGPPRDPAVWGPHVEDETLEDLRLRDEARVKEEDRKTGEIRAGQASVAEEKKKARRDLKSSLPAGSFPASPADLAPLFHFPPQAQYMTGTCWAFAGISFLESEVQRLTGQEVKLSELYPVYWEYVEKAREYVRTRGASAFSEGSQLGAVLRMFELHGAVPLAAYRGVAAEDGRHDHQRLFRELSGFLQHVKATGLWDEELVTGTVRSILDRHLGPPPERFEHGGATFTPAEFLEQVLRLRPGDYVEFMSTTSKAFWTQAEFEVPDNWWHDASYWNVPLEDFYKVLLSALRAGFTAGIGGDVSEPGKVPEQDVAFVPTFDIPPDRIDQDAREYRIWNGSTGDDHGIHAVGLGRMKGHDWFLIKDSGRSARKGKHEGYYFFRGDFIRLKMLTILVHRDAARDLLETIRKRQASSTSASVAP